MIAQVETCPVCGGSRETIYGPVTVPINQTITVEQCQACGLAERQPGTAFDFTNLPANAYMDDWEALDLSGLRFKYERMSEAARDLAPWVVKDGPWGRALLDVGCGPGYFCMHARANGWRAQGVDNWREIAAWGQKHLKVEIEPKKIEDSATPENEFEVVTAFDVITFTDDPVAFLKACRTRLKPGGMLMVSTTNFDAEGRKAEGVDWPPLGANVRRWFFSPKSLEEACRKAGYGASRVLLAGGPDNDQELILFAQNPFKTAISWTDIAEDEHSDNMLPPLDRKSVDVSTLNEDQRFWRENGYLILRNFIPADVIDRYCRVREKVKSPGGWDDETPYMEIKEIRDLCLHGALMEKLEKLIGEPMVMNLNLTGWKTTQRDWHQDDYLNPDEVRGRYVACWFALDTITADSGPFQFVPGSHQWPHIKKSKILNFVPEEVRTQRSWPIHSERVLTPFFESKIAEENLEKVDFLAEKGDVLIWHARLLHRGTVAKNPNAVRKAIITHYTALGAMSAYGPVERWNTGGLYFADPSKREVDPEREVLG